MISLVTAGMSQHQFRQVSAGSLVALLRSVVKQLMYEQLPATLDRLHDSDSDDDDDCCQISTNSRTRLVEQFFAVLDYVFTDGISCSANIFSNRRGPFEAVAACMVSANAYTDSIDLIHELTNIKDSVGRLRAWFRLCIMRKILSDCLQVVIEKQQHVLSRFYSRDAVVLSDEASVIPGVCVPCSTFSWIFDLKTSDFTYPIHQLDFTLHLRDRALIDGAIGRDIGSRITKRLPATNGSTDDSIFSSVNVNPAECVSQCGCETGGARKCARMTVMLDAVRQSLSKGSLVVKSLQALDVSIACNQTTHEELDIVGVRLRSMLSDQRAKIADLEVQVQGLGEVNECLEARLNQALEDLAEKRSSLSRLERLHQDTMEQHARNCERMSCDNMASQSYRRICEELEKAKLERYVLKEKNEEQLRTISDLARKLEQSTIDAERAREQNDVVASAFYRWLDDDAVVRCMSCSKEFSFSTRKHHCRRCGGIFCSSCSSRRASVLKESQRQVRVCDRCFELKRFNSFVQSSTTMSSNGSCTSGLLE